MSNEPVVFQPISLADLTPQEAVLRVVQEAAESQASDIFFLSEEGSLVIAARRMGIMETLATVSKDQGRHLINYVKATAGLDIAERRRPLEGRWIVDRTEGRLDLRINIIPTLFG